MEILNLSQNQATPEQKAAGVVDLSAEDFIKVQELLTFTEVPTKAVMIQRAKALNKILVQNHYHTAMVSGAMYFMSTLEQVFAKAGNKVVHSVGVFSNIEGSNTFKHIGFVEAA